MYENLKIKEKGWNSPRTYGKGCIITTKKKRMHNGLEKKMALGIDVMDGTVTDRNNVMKHRQEARDLRLVSKGNPK